LDQNQLTGFQYHYQDQSLSLRKCPNLSSQRTPPRRGTQRSSKLDMISRYLTALETRINLGNMSKEDLSDKTQLGSILGCSLADQDLS
jgi:hypothetical protein